MRVASMAHRIEKKNIQKFAIIYPNKARRGGLEPDERSASPAAGTFCGVCVCVRHATQLVPVFKFVPGVVSKMAWSRPFGLSKA